MNSQLNNEKVWLFKGKTTKSSTTFRTNKPNSPIVQTDVTNLITMNYTNFTSLTKVKNKPNQTQTKPIFNYPCVFQLAVYNPVLSDSNIRNFNGDFTKWQMHRKQMQ